MPGPRDTYDLPARPTRAPGQLTAAQQQLQLVATVQLGLALGCAVSWRTRRAWHRYRDPMQRYRDVSSVEHCEPPDEAMERQLAELDAWAGCVVLRPLSAEETRRYGRAVVAR